MKQSFFALAWLKIWGFILLAVSVGAIFILADAQSLSYFSLLLFKHQEGIKTLAIGALFLAVFFIFYPSSKLPDHILHLKLGKGSMKMEPHMLKQALQIWLKEQKINDFVLLSVTIAPENQIGLELKTSNLSQALYSLEDVEMRLQAFMGNTFGIKTPLNVELIEV